MGLGEKVSATISGAIAEATDKVRDTVSSIFFNASIDVLKRLEQEAVALDAPAIDRLLEESTLPPEVRNLLTQARSPTSPGPAMLLLIIPIMLAWASFNQLSHSLSLPVMQAIKRTYPYEIPDHMAVLQAGFRGISGPIDTRRAITSMGFDEAWIPVMQAALRPLVRWEELRQMLLRGAIDDAEFDRRMAAAGWLPEDIDRLRRLHELIPGVQDLVRFAVREAFNPEIIAKFQQHGDFPAEYGAWAAKLGLSDFWAKAYWAAHWELPSIGQGFEMMQRGIISEDELQLLLRTQDVMPFWRERLTKMSFIPFTRVDIRRMYQLKILTLEEVERAYRDIGYDPDKAAKLAQFTAKLDAGEDRELTRSDILGAYSRHTITREKAAELIRELDYDAEETEFLLVKEDAKNQGAQRDLTTAQYQELYTRGVLTQLQTTAALAELGYSQAEIALLYKLWAPQLQARTSQPSRTDLASLYHDGIISLPTWREEMGALGYSSKYLDWFEKALSRARDTGPQKDLTTAQYRDLFLRKILTQPQIASALKDLGYSEAETALLFKLWTPVPSEPDRELTVSQIQDIFLAGLRSQAETETALKDLGFDREEVALLIRLWLPEVKTRISVPSRADLARFFQEGVISLISWRAEMRRLGYADGYIDWYEALLKFPEAPVA